MTVYIACPYPERDYAIAVMLACEARGLTVTSRWLKKPDELADQFAREDLQDVAAADCLLALNPPGYADRGTGGRHVELGYALALGKLVVLVGSKTNIFHYLDSLVRVDSLKPDAIAQELLLVASWFR